MKSYLAAVLLSLCPAYALSRLAQVLDADLLDRLFLRPLWHYVFPLSSGQEES